MKPNDIDENLMALYAEVHKKNNKLAKYVSFKISKTTYQSKRQRIPNNEQNSHPAQLQNHKQPDKLHSSRYFVECQFQYYTKESEGKYGSLWVKHKLK